MGDKQYLGRPGEGLLNNPSLPTVVPFGNLRIHIDMYKKERDFREISSLMKAASEEGIGFDSKEFVTNDDVDRKLNKSVGYILRDTSETGPLVAASFMVPCSLSRSERPVYWGGNGVVSKKYRSQGIAEFLLTAIRHLSRGQGHNAVLARHTITAKSNLPGRSCGAVYLGIIPKSIRIRKPKCGCR